MADELIDIFDGNNKPTGIRKMKSEAHRDGLYHRAAHVWIYNSKGEVLLQLRAKDKETDPNRWDISAAGHVGAGEDPVEAAIRETKEELGLSIKKEDLEFIMIRNLSLNYSSTITNREFQYAYLLRFDGDIGTLKAQEEEVQEIKFVSISSVLKDLKTEPEKYRYVSHNEYWLTMLSLMQKKFVT